MIIWEKVLDFYNFFFQQGGDLDASAFQRSLPCRREKIKPPSESVSFEWRGVIEKPILLGYLGVFLEEDEQGDLWGSGYL